MAIFGFLAALFDKGFGPDEISRRLDAPLHEIQSADVSYRSFSVPKRSGGTRLIAAPNPSLKKLQRRILKRLLARLKSHPAVEGFERKRSIVTNARHHVGKAVILRIDVKDFFPSTSAARVEKYFRRIGWNKDAAQLLTRLTTLDGSLPQGAPTSPRLSNVVNFPLDARLAGLARRFGAAYTRYADDITFSLEEDDSKKIRTLIHCVRLILQDYAYRLHSKKKLFIRRRHQCQKVTGLVVNESVNLPRRTRRWLRAVEHHAAAGRACSLSKEQLTGWRALASMVERPRPGRAFPRPAS